MPESSPLTPRTATGTYRTELYVVVGGVDWAKPGTVDARNAISTRLLKTSNAIDLMGPPLPRGEPAGIRLSAEPGATGRPPRRAEHEHRLAASGHDPAHSS